MSYIKSIEIGDSKASIGDHRFETDQFYELSLGEISDTVLDKSQNAILQKIINGLLVGKTYTIKYGKQILSAMPTKKVDYDSSYYTLVSNKGMGFTIIKVKVNGATNIVKGAIRYEVSPISYNTEVPEFLFPGTVFCKINSSEDK